MPAFILLFIAILFAISYAFQVSTMRGRDPLYGNYIWFSGLWFVQLSILILPIYDFFEQITFDSALFIIGAHAAFAAGGIIVMITHQPMAAKAPAAPHKSSYWFVVLSAFIGSISQATLSANNMIGSGISLSARLSSNDYAQARLANFEFNPYFLGPLIGPIQLMTSFAYIAVTCYAYHLFNRENWTRKPTLGTISAIMAVFTVLFHQLVVAGGRIAFLFVIFIFFATAFVFNSKQQALRRHLKARNVVVFLVIFVLAATGSSLLQQFRGNSSDPFLAMVDGHGTSVKPYLYNAVRESELLGNFVLQGSYLTAPPHILSNYLEMPQEQQPGPFWGRYNFHTIYRNVARFSPGYDAEFWQQDRGELFLYQIRLGRNPNTWATIIRDLNGDFGKVGTIVFLFLAGVFGQLLLDSFQRRPDEIKSSLIVIFRMVLAFSALHSLLFIGWVVPAMLIIVTILVSRTFFPTLTRRGSV